MSRKTYLGDGAYVDFDGYHIVLTAENGITATDRVCLDPGAFQQLVDWVRDLKKEHTRLVEGEQNAARAVARSRDLQPREEVPDSDIPF